MLERCRRFNISGCTILDCDNRSILMDDVEDTIVTGCLVHGKQQDADTAAALVILGGRGNLITNNIFKGRLVIAAGSAKVVNNLQK